MCKKCFPHITRKSFLLYHDNYKDFMLTMWCDFPIVYAAWSTICAIYTFAMGIYSGYETGYDLLIFIWLTYWNHFCLTVRFVVTAGNACWFVVRERRENAYNFTPAGEETSTDGGVLPGNVALQWLLQNITNTVTLLVALLFWTLIYTGRPQDYASINSHALNALIVMADIFVSRAPINMLHFHMPVSFLGIYIIFTLIYWAGGGRNHEDKPYIYDMLDYSNKPVTALITICCVAFIAVPLMQAALYATGRMRSKLYAFCVEFNRNDW